jgi:hypothetical protein
MEFSRQHRVSSSIYYLQNDLSLKNEPPFCLYFLMNHHLCLKNAGYDCGRKMSHISGNADEAQKAETVPSVVIYIYIYIL